MQSTYMIFDDKAIAQPGSAWTAESLAHDIDSGKVLKAESVTDLAAVLHLPVSALQSTIDEWNRAAAEGKDEKFGRRSGLRSLHAPFYAYKNRATNLGAIGGLKINTDCQVLNSFGRVIQGLYAAGLCAGGWIGSYYPGSGTAISGIVHQGRKAASHLVGK